MAKQDVTEAAKQGSTQAIASLINKTLQAKGMLALVTKKGGQLKIKIQSQSVPEQQVVMNFIRSGILKLQPIGISGVEVEAWSGMECPDWQESFDLGEGKGKQISVSRTLASSQKEKIKPPAEVVISKAQKNAIFSTLKNSFSNRMIERAALVSGTFLLTSIFWLSIGSIRANTPNRSTARYGAGTDSEFFIIGYLDEITQTGLDGSRKWCAEQEKLTSTLFSPRSYEILTVLEAGETSSATVRIESSNRGGSPIFNTWLFLMSRGETVQEKEYSEKGDKKTAREINKENKNWCISALLEK